MRSLLVLFIALLVSACTDHSETKKITEKSTQDSSYLGRSQGTLYEAAQVKVDTEENEIQILRGILTGSERMFGADGSVSEFQCGISMEDGSSIKYELVDPSTLQLDIAGKVIKLSRIHLTHEEEENPVYGDWEFREVGKNFSRRWTFFIRNDDIMNVDFSCSNEFFKQ